MKAYAFLGGFALAAGLMLLACGGSDPLDDAIATMNENDLAIMVLDQDELGDVASAMEVSDEAAGFMDVEAVADDFFPHDSDAAHSVRVGNRLAALGYEGGYELAYQDLTAFNRPGAPMFAWSQVLLFADEEGAIGHFQLTLEDARNANGEWSEGVFYDTVELYTVPELADEGSGVVFNATFAGSDASVNAALVTFRLDRLVASTGVMYFESESDHRALAEELARNLEAKIRGVLLGEILGTPVRLSAGRRVRACRSATGGCCRGPSLEAFTTAMGARLPDRSPGGSCAVGQPAARVSLR